MLIKDKLVLKDKPSAATARGWREWHRDAKRAQPFAYWLNEVALDWLEDRWKDIKSPFDKTRWYIRYRVFDRYHVIPTGLEPGYHDCDTRLLHGMFNLLVDFVEIEKAWMHVVFDDAEWRRRQHPWWSKGWTRFKGFRDPDAGLAHLDWEMTLDDPKLSEYERCDSQAAVAREIKALYDWWKNVRPMRPDPMKASGWSDYCDKRREVLEEKGIDDSLSFLDDEHETDEDKAESLRIIDKTRSIETAYDLEDEQMLMRLIKIRKSLWT